MTSRDFCFWLQGFMEVACPDRVNERETDLIRAHLAMVFKHEIDPSMPDPTGELQALHDQTASPYPKPNPLTYPPSNPPSAPVMRC